MADIYYSQVDSNLANELNTRGKSGRNSRTTADINFMVGKTANVQLYAWEITEGGSYTLVNSLHGYSVISANQRFMPNGDNGYLSADNPSKRVAPFISSTDISIGDNSNGLLNTCTFIINVPDPTRDLDEIESIYCRPGRRVQMRIEHPTSAIIGGEGYLSDKRLDSTNKLLNLSDINEKSTDIKDKFKMNRVTFDGNIIKFDLQYQTDFSVVISITARGTTQQYTDLSLIIDNDVQPNENKKTSDFNLNAGDPVVIPDDIDKTDKTKLSFYDQLSKSFDNYKKSIRNKTDKSEATELEEEVIGEYNLYPELKSNTPVWGAYGNPYSSHQSEQYISLSWLIQFLNYFIILKQTYSDKRNLIVFTSQDKLCVSNSYKLLCSADPLKIYFPSNSDSETASDSYGNLKWFSKQSSTLTFDKDGVGYTENIMINLTLIESIVTTLEANGMFTVNELLKKISEEIFSVSGGAINMKLITHPELTDFLLLYDANYVNLEEVTPYSVPMSMTHIHGSIVKDFKIASRLPDSLSSLMYTVTQKPNQVSDSKIAPFISYLYADSQQSKDEIQAEYKKQHERYSAELIEARKNFGKKPDSTETKKALAAALKKYVQYPTPTIKESLELAPPVLPFDAEFTIDGINGFRYGDVLTFDVLPARFRYNTVFLIVGVNHTVTSDNIWNTTIRCIGRPKID